MTVSLKLLLTLLFITSPAWTASCPGSENCQICKVATNDIYYLHYGIIENLDLSSIFHGPETTIINCKNPSNKSDLSDLNYYADFKHTIKFVTITNVNVVTVPSNLFSKAFNLEYLDLSQNKITFISDELFNDCTNLNSLNLSSNDLSTVSFKSDQAFPGLQKLEYLDLSNNMISSLDKNILSGLSSLRYLDMSRNNMKTIHRQAFLGLSNLKTIDFSYNALTLKENNILNSEYGPVSPFHHSQQTLEEINLAYNNIDKIFGDWIFAARLKILNLSHNHFSVIEDTEIQFLSNNINVDLSSNGVKKINYGQVELLDEYSVGDIVVNIENNPIQCDCEMSKMALFLELKYPKVDKRFISSAIDKFKCGKQNKVPNSVCKLDHSLETVIGACPSRCNCIINPEKKSIFVNCSYRGLDKAPATIPWFAGANVEVNLTGNHLTKIPSRNQKGYEHVTVLALSHNKISKIPIDMPLKNLEKLYLDNNELVRINYEVLDVLRTSTKIKNLSLHGNKLKCNCHARNLTVLIQMMDQKIPELRNVTCYGYDLPIYTINLNRLCSATRYWILILCIIIGILGFIGGIILTQYLIKRNRHNNRRKTVYNNKHGVKSIFVV